MNSVRQAPGTTIKESPSDMEKKPILPKAEQRPEWGTTNCQAFGTAIIDLIYFSIIKYSVHINLTIFVTPIDLRRLLKEKLFLNLLSLLLEGPILNEMHAAFFFRRILHFRYFSILSVPAVVIVLEIELINHVLILFFIFEC